MSTSTRYGIVRGTLPTPEGDAPVRRPPPNPMNGRNVTHISKAPPTAKAMAVKAQANKSRFAKKMRLALYTPNNPSLFNAAIVGFLSGVFFGREMTLTDPTAYDAIDAEAEQYAKAVDSAIAPGSPSEAQVSLIQSLSQSVTASKYATGLPASAWAAQAAAVAASYSAASSVFVAVPAPGGGGSVYTLDITGLTGTYVYAGPTPPPSTIEFIGTGPLSPFLSVVMPDGAYTTTFINRATYPVFVGTAADFAESLTSYFPPVWLIQDVDTTVTPCQFAGAWFNKTTSAAWHLSAQTATDYGDVGIANASGEPQLYVRSLGGANNIAPGRQPGIVTYGSVQNQQPADLFGVALPPTSAGPIVGQLGTKVWSVTKGVTADGEAGLVGVSAGGGMETLISEVYYPNAPWNTQAQDTDAIKFGDTLVGPGVSSVVSFTPDVGNTLSILIIQARVVSTSGITEAVGDSYSALWVACCDNVGGVVSVLPLATTVPYARPNGSISTSIPSWSTDGTSVQLSFVTDITVDPSTVIDIQWHLKDSDTL